MLYLITILFPVIAGTLVSVFGHEDNRIRNVYYIIVMLITDVLGVCSIFMGKPIKLFQFVDYVTVNLRLDSFGSFVLVSIMLLYTVTLFYTFEYADHDERQKNFVAYMFASMAALMGVCMASNLVTMYLFFEALTLSSFPMILHDKTKEAVTAGLKYMFYSIAGALMGMMAVFSIYAFSKGTSNFILGGYIQISNIQHKGLFLALVFVGIMGFGAKAGMLPLSGWLPTAHPIAPAPASALMSGIIAKAGIIAVVRLTYYAVGIRNLRGTWVQIAWMIMAMLSILMGSGLAYREQNLKKRLAYSTVSQMSYIMLGVSFLNNLALKGGLIQLMSHSAAKGCLFLIAGVFIHNLGKREVTELKGIGIQMPITIWCFAFASMNLIGIPPFGGFVGKWLLANVAINSNMGVFAYLAPIVLLISAFLTAGYTLPIVVEGFFPGEEVDLKTLPKMEPNKLMLIPLIILCAMALFMGLFGMSFVNIV